MECRNRKGQIIAGGEKQDAFLEKLYGTGKGRKLLKILVRPWVSKLGGAVLSTRISSLGIPKFIRDNKIDMSQYEARKFRSYNDFFTRKIKAGMRPIEPASDSFIAPCDSRLTVDDYHRYCYVDNGVKSRDTYINGVFHTVNPYAGQILPIYKENSRCYCALETENFGKLLHMEVGALMVGKIVNYHRQGGFSFKRGQEKGRFEFGGSTVILCAKKDVLRIDEDILANSREGIETKVRMGEKIGEKA